MTEDYKKIAESIRSGKYFGDARGWFDAVYIGPISERTFFLIIAVLAGLIFLFGVSAVSRLMPLTKKEAVLIRAGDRPDEVQHTLIQLAKNRAPINPSISKFFVTNYVQQRESYDIRTFTKAATLVRAQSAPEAYNAYAAAYAPNNAQSPFAGLGDMGQRLVTVESVEPVNVRSRDNPNGHEFAKVTFTAETTGVTAPTKTRWTANIEYIYTGLESKMVENPETKQEELQVTDPHFQVVNYALTQAS